MSLRTPFPWFGGKSRVAHLVWDAFGDVANYVEPFAGSLAVVLGRPSEPRIETVNDLDCYLSNFWRAVQHSPNEVARWADWPVNEADLHSRHRWLVDQATFRERMKSDPDFYDAKIAGWWVWGICQWIGGGWCTDPEWRGRANAAAAPLGINTVASGRKNRNRGEPGWDARPAAHGMGLNAIAAQRPVIERGGRGVHSSGLSKRERDLSGAGGWRKRPVLGRGGGRGVNASALSRHLPNLSGDCGAAGRGIHASGMPTEGLWAWMRALADRLRRVRVCCGDWQRVLGPAVTTCIGTTGVFLDPPYADTAGRDPSIYACDSLDVAHQVREWAIANGDDPKLRIALCGYEGEHQMPPTWTCVAWKASGGYGSRNPKNKNAARERIWFSPHCLGARQRDLFAAIGRSP